MDADPDSREGWVADAEHLFSASHLARVRNAFVGTGSVVFGFQWFYKGGSSRDDVCFTSFEEFARRAEAARPGDIFELFDLEVLADRAAVHTSDPTSTEGVRLTDAEWTALRSCGGQSKEVVAVRRFIGSLTGRVEASSETIDTAEEEDLQDTVQRWAWSTGELFVFGLAYLDGEEGADPHLLTAKRPDRHGRIPLRGPY